jgi:hypothetical protein
MSASSLPYSPRSVTLTLRPVWNAPLPLHLAVESAASAAGLSPDHFRRGFTRLVSCYALFKWWLPLSQHPSCHRKSTSFITEPALGALAGDLGCFPFDYEVYPPQSDSTRDCNGIRSLTDVGTPVRALFQPVLYHRYEHSRRLSLKVFRGEPAITKFDKSFAPTHSSSKAFSTATGSALHPVLPGFQPVHG